MDEVLYKWQTRVMREAEGTPLTSAKDAPICEAAPHFYIVVGDPADELVVVPYSAQHCCMDHTDQPCYGWICIEMKHLGEKAWQEANPIAAVSGSPHPTP